MKLISLNVEGLRHTNRVAQFLETENADIVCLQEASEENVKHLEHQGYHVSVLPRCIKKQDDATFIDSNLIATKITHLSSNHYYYEQVKELPTEEYNKELGRHLGKHGIIVCTFAIPNETFTVCTTHFTWTPDGSTASDAQQTDMKELLEYTTSLPPHILCGDFNIPRHHNPLYKNLLGIYTDNIPDKYKSSLDPELHRLNKIPEKKHLVGEYMVDYLFTQAPYSAENVRLEFGISDHAAVIADISKN